MTGGVKTAVGAALGSGANEDEGLTRYYTSKIDELTLTVQEKSQDLRRLQAQRNELNAKVRMLREELQLLVSSTTLVGKIDFYFFSFFDFSCSKSKGRTSAR